MKITVKATDRGLQPMSSQVQVTLTRTIGYSPPEWQPIRVETSPGSGRYRTVDIHDFELNINEDEDGITLEQFYANTTADITAEINYAIQEGGREQENSRRTFQFTAVSDAGTVQIEYDDTDFEEISKYNINLRASYLVVTKNTLSQFHIPVTINDINDNKPVWIGFNKFDQYIGHTSTEFGPNTPVTSVFAIDRDGTSPNNKVGCYM